MSVATHLQKRNKKMDLYQFYPREWMEKATTPVAYAVHTDAIQDCAEQIIGRRLTDEEMEIVPFAFDAIGPSEQWRAAVGLALDFVEAANVAMPPVC
jgi:hypothetical protein